MRLGGLGSHDASLSSSTRTRSRDNTARVRASASAEPEATPGRTTTGRLRVRASASELRRQKWTTVVLGALSLRGTLRLTGRLALPVDVFAESGGVWETRTRSAARQVKFSSTTSTCMHVNHLEEFKL